MNALVGFSQGMQVGDQMRMGQARNALTSALQTGDRRGAFNALAQVDPMAAMQMQQPKKPDTAMIGNLVKGVLAAPEDQRPQLYAQGVQTIRGLGGEVGPMFENYDPVNLQALAAATGVSGEQFDPDRYKVVGGRLVDLRAPGGPAITIDNDPQDRDPIAALRARAIEANLQPGTPEYEQFMAQGGSIKAPERWIDLTPAEIAERGLKPGIYQREANTDQIRSTGAGGMTVNVNGDQNEFDKVTAKRFGERFVVMNDNAIKAQGNLASLATMERALDNPAVYTGAGGETIQQLRRIGVAFGANPDEINAVADGEVVQSVSRQLALMLRDPSSGAGMPGAMSDSDRSFLVSMVAGLTMSPEGNRRLIKVAKRVAQRQIKISEMANQYVDKNGKLDGGFQRELSQFAEQNPLFTMDDYGTAVRSMSDEELRRLAGE